MLSQPPTSTDRQRQDYDRLFAHSNRPASVPPPLERSLSITNRLPSMASLPRTYRPSTPHAVIPALFLLPLDNPLNTQRVPTVYCAQSTARRPRHHRRCRKRTRFLRTRVGFRLAS
jgi:hypothetical protein